MGLAMTSRTTAVFAGLALLLMLVPHAQAEPNNQPLNCFPIFGSCSDLGKPPEDKGMPQAEDLLKIVPSSKKKLNDEDLYAVTISCKLKKNKSLSDWNPFWSKTVATSHIVALTNTKLSQQELPTNARATITVFAISGDDSNKKIFLNDHCQTQFLISGREKVFIAATANQSTTNQPGPLSRFLFQTIQVALPILPLIQGTTLVGTMLTDVGKTQDPLNKLFAELNKGRTYTESNELYLDDTKIVTPYSEVTINVAKIKSVLDAGQQDFRKIFEDATDSAESTLALSGAANPAQKCGEFSSGLRGRNFSPTDIAYALILVSQAANLNQTNTLDCLGKRFALTALGENEDRAWNRYFGKVYSAADAKSYFAENGGPITRQPKFANWQGKLGDAAASLGAYLQNGGKVKGDVNRYFADPIQIENHTSFYSDRRGETSAPLSEFLSTLIAKNFRRAGCLTSDTEALASIVLFRTEKVDQGPPNTFNSADTVIMRVWYNESQLVYRLQLEYDVGLVEKALSARQSRVCGENLEVLAPPKPAG
jgi:hypothetical protein